MKTSYYLEKNICSLEDIKLHNFPISSRDIPDRSKLIGFKKLLDQVEYPCLMHCKSGADRAGLAAALYLIYKKNYNLEKTVIISPDDAPSVSAPFTKV